MGAIPPGTADQTRRVGAQARFVAAREPTNSHLTAPDYGNDQGQASSGSMPSVQPIVVVPAAAHGGTLVQLRDHCLHHMSAASFTWVALNGFLTAYHLFKAMPAAAEAHWYHEGFVVVLETLLLFAEFLHALQLFKHSSPHLHVDTGWVVLLHRMVVIAASLLELFVRGATGYDLKTGYAVGSAPSFVGFCFNVVSNLFTTWWSLKATMYVFQAVRETHLEKQSKQLRERVYRCRPGWATDYGSQVSTSLGDFRRKHAIELTGGSVYGWQADYGLAVSPWGGDARRIAAVEAWNEKHQEKLKAYKEALSDNGYLTNYGSSVTQENGERRRRKAEARVDPYDTFITSSSCASGRVKRVDVSDIVTSIEKTRLILEKSLREMAEMEEEEEEEEQGGTSLSDQEEDQDVYYSVVKNQYKQE